MDAAIVYAKQFPGGYRELSTQAGVGYEWLVKLVRGEFADPGTRRIERLLIHAADTED